MFEQPLMILVWSVVVLAAMAAWYVATQSRMALIACVLVAVGGIGALIAERMVITPKEQIRIDLDQLASALETNNIDAVSVWIDPESEQILAEVRQAMRLATVKKVSIKNNLKVQLTPGDPPTRARATFNAVATLQLKTGEPHIAPRIVELMLAKGDRGWRVKEYELKAPIE